jgi:hypothetical protein
MGKHGRTGSLPGMVAATAARPTAVLTGPLRLAGDQETAHAAWPRARDSHDMVRVGLNRLTATAVVAWSGDLPRHLQQVLYDTADAENAIPPDGRLPSAVRPGYLRRLAPMAAVSK